MLYAYRQMLTLVIEHLLYGCIQKSLNAAIPTALALFSILTSVIPAPWPESYG